MAERGRKTLFREYMIQEAYKLGILGLTVQEIANIWDVSERVLYRWQNRHLEFSQSLKRGKEEADAAIVQSLFQQAKDGNITAIIFWLKNRQPDKWRDKAIEIKNVINNRPINAGKLTDEDRRFQAEMLAKLKRRFGI